MSRIVGRSILAFSGVILWSCLWLESPSADVYKRVGRNGQVVFTDRPAGSGYSLVIRSNPQSSQSPAAPAHEDRRSSMVHRLNNGQVILGNANQPRHSERGSVGRPMALIPHHRRAEEFSALIDWAATQHGLDPWLLHAVIRAESAYNPGAVSSKGAMGLMQLMPGTAARYGVTDPFNPMQNVLGGARYLRDLMGLFDSDVRLAVAAYNAGEGSVQKYGNQVPPFEETRGYVSKVLEFYRR